MDLNKIPRKNDSFKENMFYILQHNKKNRWIKEAMFTEEKFESMVYQIFILFYDEYKYRMSDDYSDYLKSKINELASINGIDSRDEKIILLFNRIAKQLSDISLLMKKLPKPDKGSNDIKKNDNKGNK
jgi:hypothetical protein